MPERAKQPNNIKSDLPDVVHIVLPDVAKKYATDYIERNLIAYNPYTCDASVAQTFSKQFYEFLLTLSQGTESSVNGLTELIRIIQKGGDALFIPNTCYLDQTNYTHGREKLGDNEYAIPIAGGKFARRMHCRLYPKSRPRDGEPSILGRFC